MKRIICPYEIVCCILLLAVIAAGLVLPKTGPLVLLDEVCDSLTIWFGCIWIIIRILRSKGMFTVAVKIARIAAIIICIAVGLWFSSDTAVDFITGTQTETLSDIQISRTQAHTGIFSLHYYLTGTDSSGEHIRLEISGKDYSELSGRNTVRVEYYRNTGRIVRFM